MDIRKFFQKSSGEGPGHKRPRLDTIGDVACSDEPERITDLNISTLSELSSTRKLDSVLDLSKKDDPILQVILKEFPRSNNRSFRSAWYTQFIWLEYSVQKDAAFCYACRHFNQFGTKEDAFTENGFKNWKSALETARGFPKHEKSEAHIQAMMLWNEKKMRVSSCASISTLINDSVLKKNRYYVKSIIEVIQFLTANELALRGNYVIEEHAERGLLVKLFEFTLKKDKFLSECASIIPRNATYLSPETQNELIKIMTAVVRESVADDINNADIPWFTLLEDGTRDKNNRENIAIAIRYVKDGQVQESLLDVITTTDLDAETFTEATLKTLENHKIDKSRILSQCFDGAPVMSGINGGVAALIPKYVGRKIPYIHSFNHRLHLVLIKTISEVTEVKHFFEQCVMLHNFFHHPNVSGLYDGKAIVRLLEQRWSGHFKITNAIFCSYKEIIDVLNEIPGNKKFDGEDIAKSKGIKSVMLSTEFRFCLVMCKKLLGILHPADAILQDPKSSLKEGIDVIKTVKSKVEEMRTDEHCTLLINEAQKLIPETEKTQQRPKRHIKPKTLKNFIFTEKNPANTSSCSELQTQTRIKSVCFETIDTFLSEIKARFSDNEELLLAMSSVEEFDESKLQCLKELGINIPSKEELSVVKSFLADRKDTESLEFDLANKGKKKKRKDEKRMVDLLYNYREAFKTTYQLLAAVDTFGCSTATCESTFSTLTAINRPQRLSMTHQRMADLVYLAFERKRTENVDIELILKRFNAIKDRRLQLY